MQNVFSLTGPLGHIDCLLNTEKGRYELYFEPYCEDGEYGKPILSQAYKSEEESFKAAKYSVGLEDCASITLESVK